MCLYESAAEDLVNLEQSEGLNIEDYPSWLSDLNKCLDKEGVKVCLQHSTIEQLPKLVDRFGFEIKS